MGWLALLWTYLRGHVVVGNGTSLTFHAAMQFHAFSLTKRQLRSTLMTTTSKHIQGASNPNWTPICAASNKEKATW